MKYRKWKKMHYPCVQIASKYFLVVTWQKHVFLETNLWTLGSRVRICLGICSTWRVSYWEFYGSTKNQKTKYLLLLLVSVKYWDYSVQYVTGSTFCSEIHDFGVDVVFCGSLAQQLSVSTLGFPGFYPSKRRNFKAFLVTSALNNFS